MLRRILLVLVLISIPAWGDTLQFSSLANSWIQGSVPGEWDGFNAWFLEDFEVAGGPGGIPTAGIGSSSDPYRYLNAHIYLQDDPSLGHCSVPAPFPFGDVCASLNLSNITGYFIDPNTFQFHSYVSGRIDPLIYTYFGLPQGYLDAVGELSFQLNYSATDPTFGRYYGGFTDSGMILHPVPEPTTVLLFGTGIGAVIARKRMRA